jgi:hypothetical protein
MMEPKCQPWISLIGSTQKRGKGTGAEGESQRVDVKLRDRWLLGCQIECQGYVEADSMTDTNRLASADDASSQRKWINSTGAGHYVHFLKGITENQEVSLFRGKGKETTEREGADLVP